MPARLLRIPQGLSEAQHRAASKRIAREGLEGLCMTYLGGAYGPVWSGAVVEREQAEHVNY